MAAESGVAQLPGGHPAHPQAPARTQAAIRSQARGDSGPDQRPRFTESAICGKQLRGELFADHRAAVVGMKGEEGEEVGNSVEKRR